jgi:hypothetical protein
LEYEEETKLTSRRPSDSSVDDFEVVELEEVAERVLLKACSDYAEACTKDCWDEKEKLMSWVV